MTKASILDDSDYCFLVEFLQVLQPVAESITVLEGQSHGFGYYLPILMELECSLETLKGKRFK